MTTAITAQRTNPSTTITATATLTAKPVASEKLTAPNPNATDVFTPDAANVNPRLDTRRFPNANSPDSMKWVDAAKADLDPATYGKIKDAFSQMKLPDGFDAVLLGPSRHWPSPAVEVAVKLPNGSWEQNAYLPENGKITQLSNLDPSHPSYEASQANRPPELKGATLAAEFPLELEAPEEANPWVVQNETPEGQQEVDLASQLVGEAQVPEGVSDVKVLGHSSAKVWQDQPEPHFELTFMRDGQKEQGAFKFDNGHFTQVSTPPDGKPPVTLSLPDAGEPNATPAAAETPPPAETKAAPGADMSRVNLNIPIRPELQAAVTELQYQGLDVKLLGASNRKGDKFENFELMVNGKQGTYLNDNGLLVNRDNDGERLNGRSKELNDALNAEHAAQQAQKAQNTRDRTHAVMDRLNRNGSLDLESLDD